MAYGQVNADVIGTSVSGSNLGAGNASIMKNRIINGDCRIDQRNAGASVTITTANQYTVDRWQGIVAQSSKFTVQQNAGSVTPPSGFVNYLGATSSSAYSVVAGDYFFLSQIVEGYNFADFSYGTASAQTATLSFWVRSSLTGTFGASLYRGLGINRSYPFSYTISSANTWEQKSIVITGDTAAGLVSTTNGEGIQLRISLGAGSTFTGGTVNTWQSGNFVQPSGATSVVGTNGATFYITGVQLEVGSSATGFEYRQYQQELALCQRYYYRMNANQGQSVYTKYGQGYATSGTNFVCQINFPVTLRSYPTTLDYSTTYSWYCVYDGVSNIQATGFNFDQASPSVTSINMVAASGLTTSRVGALQAQATTSGYLGFGAEL